MSPVSLKHPSLQFLCREQFWNMHTYLFNDFHSPKPPRLLLLFITFLHPLNFQGSQGGVHDSPPPHFILTIPWSPDHLSGWCIQVSGLHNSKNVWFMNLQAKYGLLSLLETTILSYPWVGAATCNLWMTFHLTDLNLLLDMTQCFTLVCVFSHTVFNPL